MFKAILIICLSVFLTTAKAQVIQHQISDDGYVRVPLQFPFPFYGQVFTESFMFSNGVVGFLNPEWNSWCCSGFDLTRTQGTPFNFAIMPLQTDLLNYSGRFLTEGTPQYQRYMWENISEFGAPQNLNTFGVEIRPSGFIGMHYEKVNINPWRPVTIGMTGDTSLGEHTQFYHGQGFIDNVPKSYIVEATGNICVINPLANPACPNYAQAYFTQQCTISALYDPACPNYAEAYHDYQCTLSPLYASDCDGYAQAYFTQQCSLNPLYDRNCVGYAEAYALANIVTPTQSTTAISVQVSNSGTVSIETPLVADKTVNEVITKKPEVLQTAKQEPAKELPKPTEKKTEVVAQKAEKKEMPKNEMSKNAPTITQAVAIRTQDAPVILDTSYAKLLSKNIAIKDNARVNRLLNYKQDILHKELVDEQWRR